MSNTVVTPLLSTKPINWEEVLSTIIAAYGCTTGTIHFIEEDPSLLHLKAQQGIPSFLVPKLSKIPVGKGMAGIAAQRRKPVEMCNLQTDDSGVARPAAKETKVEGSIAVPLLKENKLFGTLGIAKPVPYDFTEEEITTLMAIGEEICDYVGE
ncbi:GAF domain-containing protein [Arenibacter amylolyticus]|uniref:GAF domain-containing protein n=1 Tax=Arenibacter amylolyticus TaxID=1406873 RepID=UPI000A36E0E5|nr:GAF domain-containing protein [Arenibacter amylolyticus]